MTEMFLRQPGFTQSACGPFTKTRRTDVDVYDGYKRVIALKVYKVFDKKNVWWSI